MRRAVTPIECVGEDVERVRHSAAMVLPDRIDRPQMIGRQHPPQALDGRNRWAWAGFGVEAECATVARIHIPEKRRDIFIGPGHFYATWADGRGSGCGRGNGGIRPFQFTHDPQIHLLNRWRRSKIAAIQECDDRGMTLKPTYLVTHRIGCDYLVLLVPGRPVFPLVTAAPTRQNHDP